MTINIKTDIAPELDDLRQQLMDLVVEAHQTAAKNNPNASSGACQNAFFGSGKIENGLASALLTLGTRHGPVQDARAVFENASTEYVKNGVKSGAIIPGFGNSFFKDGIDPAWEKVSEFIKNNFRRDHAKIVELNNAIRECGKNVFPNAALYTAVACSICNVRNGCEIAIFAMARIPVWTSICIQ